MLRAQTGRYKCHNDWLIGQFFTEEAVKLGDMLLRCSGGSRSTPPHPKQEPFFFLLTYIFAVKLLHRRFAPPNGVAPTHPTENPGSATALIRSGSGGDPLIHLRTNVLPPVQEEVFLLFIPVYGLNLKKRNCSRGFRIQAVCLAKRLNRHYE